MIKTVIIDDEPEAVNILEIHASKMDDLNVVASFYSPLKALDYLRDNCVDLIFLDVNMPEISGIGLLKKLKVQPLVVFTTAYEKYAVESYKFEAVDYLLKPIDFEDFQNSVGKVKKAISLNSTDIQDSSYVFIKDGKKTIRLFFENILLLKGCGNYVEFITQNGKYLSRNTILELLNSLPQHLFVRVHNSYIVNFEKVDRLENNQVIIGDYKIPVGERFRNSLLRRIQDRMI